MPRSGDLDVRSLSRRRDAVGGGWRFDSDQGPVAIDSTGEGREEHPIAAQLRSRWARWPSRLRREDGSLGGAVGQPSDAGLTVPMGPTSGGSDSGIIGSLTPEAGVPSCPPCMVPPSGTAGAGEPPRSSCASPGAGGNRRGRYLCLRGVDKAGPVYQMGLDERPGSWGP